MSSETTSSDQGRVLVITLDARTTVPVSLKLRINDIGVCVLLVSLANTVKMVGINMPNRFRFQMFSHVNIKYTF